MVRRLAPALVGIFVLFFALQLSHAGGALSVDESKIKFLLADSRARVSLPVNNGSDRSVAARVSVELLDPADKVRAAAALERTIAGGVDEVVLPVAFPLADPLESERREFPWYRLRYRVAPAGDGATVAAAEGIVSLSEITSDLFELRVVSSRRASAGSRFRARVRAANPGSQRPVKGVAVEGELKFDDGDNELNLKAKAETDGDGYAMLDFDLPPQVEDDGEGELKVTARRGVLVQEAESDVDVNQAPRVLLTTDKSLYQPGQTLHLRALVFDQSQRAIPQTDVSFEIEDPEGTTVFDESLKTSRFGVASADWQIPANTRLGDYNVSLELDDSKYDGEYGARQSVKISRYDLPNFTVRAKTDRPYYLGGENAEVEVRADYLFGQPVKRGRARVVRQTERRWNYRAQKYETKEHAAVEGEIDAEGRFVARLDLSDVHKDLAESGYARFRDLDYAAYVTDPTTNRTEQRRFSLRVTKDPVHVYVTEGRYRQADGLPLAFYVSTFYADGTPAQCEVSVNEKGETWRNYDANKKLVSEVKDPDRTILKVKTNRYGVAKVIGPVTGKDEEDSSSNLSLRFVARDGKGRAGVHEDDFWKRDGDTPEIRVETDKTLYREGEPVTVEVSANQPSLNLFVDASVENRVVTSKTVRLRGGRASLVLPYSEEFKGRLVISATTTEIPESRYDDYALGTRTVVFPRNRELRLDVRMSKASFQPGEEAGATFSVRTPDGRRAESALGVVVFDKAVEERARTEQEFGSNWGFYDAFCGFWYGPGDIAGVTPRDIEQLDLSRPAPRGLEDVAEMLFNSSRDGFKPNVFGGTRYEDNPHAVFADLLKARSKPLNDALKSDYERFGKFPTDAATLIRQLAIAGVDFSAVLDPWGTPLRADFSVDREWDVLHLWSAGADKKHGGDYDMLAASFRWPYFKTAGEKINRAVEHYHKRTGGHVRDEATLREELLREGLDLASLRDRWGRPYSFDFDVSGTNYRINVRSGGPNEPPAPQKPYDGDDFNVWTTATDYFVEKRAAIDRALDKHLRASGGFPRDVTAFIDVLRKAGLDFHELRDGWGRGLYVTPATLTRFADRVATEDRRQYDPNGNGHRTNIKPVTQTVQILTLRSAGPDGKAETPDDFTLGHFTSIATEQSAGDAAPQPVRPITTFSGGKGAITGVVTDPNGAIIAGANVKAIHNAASLEFEATTNDEGVYLLRNLPSGFYKLTFSMAGFKDTIVADVQVQSSNLTTVDIMLNVGAVAETIEVTGAQVHTLNTTSSQVSAVKKDSVITRQQLSTPRLREFFPETLVWQPELTTDKQGRANLRFKFADNITTWKMSVIASTEDGHLGAVEKEIRAFQPFFAELDPPRVLTEGDEISLPVVLRNYLDTRQPVEVEIASADWFSLNGPARKRSDVAAGDSARETFDLRAVASIVDGKQRVTAFGADASDAIEKPVTVHPDGEEKSDTDAQVFSDSTSLNLRIPADVIAGSARAELKIYPNLASHVIEGVEAIMQRPYGCGEQTISSTYPSLLVLDYYKRLRGGKEDERLPPVAVRARGYAQAGYERLLNYRAAGGGFTYWGRGEADLALTAYALRFLHDAGRVIEVDENVVRETRDWLIKQQRLDGSWPAYYWSSDKEHGRRTALNTAFVARVLAATEKVGTATNPAGANGAAHKDDKTPTPLQRAFKYLSARIGEIEEPYLIASYALAAADAGDRAGAALAVEKLRALAHDEGPASFWSLETNTPFYGWGLAGRIETTALVVKALAADCGLRIADCGLKPEVPAGASAGTDNTGSPISNPQSAIRNPQLINRGLLFLLRNKDRYGVWYSTQATVNVLDALMNLVTDGAASPQAAGSAEVFVNDRRAGALAMPPAGQLTGPVAFDLTPFVSAGDNRVEVRRAGARTQAQAQAVATFYVPWRKSSPEAAPVSSNQTANGASALRLAVNFDKTSAEINGEITCRVEAERIGHRGYGMLLAEVGLPPGADVDRASLERAMKETGWAVNSYDILPDRLVLYLWPAGGGTKFDFKFRPRFGLKAMNAPSQLYDYYNPEARTVVPPTRFVVR